MVSWRIHASIVRRLREVRCISNFRRNLISLSRLNLRGYRTVAGRGILKVLHSDRIILEEKKRMRGYYFLMESLVRGGASGARKS